MLQSLAEARAKLAAQYRDADGEFDAAEKRLRAAAADLAQQLNQLKEQRRQFQTWADERQAAIERQAARLVAREQELEAQEQRFGDCEQSWTEQRLGFRRQIRRLLAELRAADRGGAEAAAS
jgi:chromosome segregation ATPase